MIDKLLILYTVTESDIDKLALSLKTLEFFPPSIHYEVLVISDDTAQDQIKAFVKGVDGVKLHAWPGSIDEALDSAWQASDASFIMTLHPDVLFFHPSWCDILLSKMIEQHLQIVGSNQFQEFNNLYGGKIKVIPPHFIIATREALQANDGYANKADGKTRGALLHLHAAKNQTQVAGADLSSLMRHLSICVYDQRSISEDQIRKIQEEVLRHIEKV